jgi:hypothetical protein
MKVVSENPISLASASMPGPSICGGGSVTTHSWLPSSGRWQNTSTNRNGIRIATSLPDRRACRAA